MDPYVAIIRQNERRAARRRRRAVLRARLEGMAPTVAELLGQETQTMSDQNNDAPEAQTPTEAPAEASQSDALARALGSIADRLEALDRRTAPQAPRDEARPGARPSGAPVHSQQDLVRLAREQPEAFRRLMNTADDRFDPWKLPAK
jgi:hypothetical protein